MFSSKFKFIYLNLVEWNLYSSIQQGKLRGEIAKCQIRVETIENEVWLEDHAPDSNTMEIAKPAHTKL